MVSGHICALKLVSDKAGAAGALKVQTLAVAGAFHTSLMLPASKALTEVCRWVSSSVNRTLHEALFRPLQFPVPYCACLVIGAGSRPLHGPLRGGNPPSGKYRGMSMRLLEPGVWASCGDACRGGLRKWGFAQCGLLQGPPWKAG